MNRKCCSGVKSLDRVIRKDLIENVICERERQKGETLVQTQGIAF